MPMEMYIPVNGKMTKHTVMVATITLTELDTKVTG